MNGSLVLLRLFIEIYSTSITTIENKWFPPESAPDLSGLFPVLNVSVPKRFTKDFVCFYDILDYYLEIQNYLTKYLKMFLFRIVLLQRFKYLKG